MVPACATCPSPALLSFLWLALPHPSARSSASDVSRRFFLVRWAGCPSAWDSVFVLGVMATRRALHFVFKVGNRFQTVHFFRDVLGMQVQTGTERGWRETPMRGRAAPGEGGRRERAGHPSRQALDSTSSRRSFQLLRASLFRVGKPLKGDSPTSCVVYARSPTALLKYLLHSWLGEPAVLVKER